MQELLEIPFYVVDGCPQDLSEFAEVIFPLDEGINLGKRIEDEVTHSFAIGGGGGRNVAEHMSVGVSDGRDSPGQQIFQSLRPLVEQNLIGVRALRQG